MSDLAELFVRAALVENLALSFFLGMCMLLAVSRRVETALGFGAAVIGVQTLTVPLNQLIHAHLLRPGALAWAGLLAACGPGAAPAPKPPGAPPFKVLEIRPETTGRAPPPSCCASRWAMVSDRRLQALRTLMQNGQVLN